MPKVALPWDERLHHRRGLPRLQGWVLRGRQDGAAVLRQAAHPASAAASARRGPRACACRACQAVSAEPDGCRHWARWYRGGSACPPIPPGGEAVACRAWRRVPVQVRQDGWACPAVGSETGDPTEERGGCRPDRSGDAQRVGACCHRRRRLQAGWAPVHRAVGALPQGVAEVPRGVLVWRRWGALVSELGEHRQAPSTRSPERGGRVQGRWGEPGHQPVWLLQGGPAVQPERQAVPGARRVWPLAEPGLPAGARAQRVWQQPVRAPQGGPAR